MIWLHCDGEDDPDIENIGPVTYTPFRGFPGYFYPYRNQRGYLSPIVMVQLKNPMPGVSGMIAYLHKTNKNSFVRFWWTWSAQPGQEILREIDWHGKDLCILNSSWIKWRNGALFYTASTLLCNALLLKIKYVCKKQIRLDFFPNWNVHWWRWTELNMVASHHLYHIHFYIILGSVNIAKARAQWICDD